MWITKAKPHTVVKVWRTENERPPISEEPNNIQAYSALMAKELYDFKPIKK